MLMSAEDMEGGSDAPSWTHCGPMIMNKYCYNMMKNGSQAQTSGIDWAVPVCKMQKALGFDINYCGDGPCVVVAIGGCSSTVHEQHV